MEKDKKNNDGLQDRQGGNKKQRQGAGHREMEKEKETKKATGYRVSPSWTMGIFHTIDITHSL